MSRNGVPPAPRRLALALAGIVVSACILRPQMSDALVIRGDACLYRARPQAALGYYRRALWIDPDDAAAVDRFAFVAMTLRNAPSMRDGVAMASRYLRRHGDDSVVRMDRALAYRALGATALSREDFALVGARTGDPRAYTFAAYAAQATGEGTRARALLRAALARAPHFTPALRALLRLEGRR